MVEVNHWVRDLPPQRSSTPVYTTWWPKENLARLGLEPQTSPTGHMGTVPITPPCLSNRFGPRPVPIPGIISNGLGPMSLLVQVLTKADFLSVAKLCTQGLKSILVEDLLPSDSLLPCCCEQVYWSTWIFGICDRCMAIYKWTREAYTAIYKYHILLVN